MATTIDPTSPPRSLSELEDVSDTTSSLGSGDWTDLSSAHADDVSDNASVDGSEAPAIARLNDGSEEAWTSAAMSSSSASLYASVHAPNPFDSDAESDKSIRPLPAPLDHFHDSNERLELGLVLPDPLERSESTVAADLLSFSDDVVLATDPTAVVSLAGAHPSIAQRTVVVTDVLVAIARATNSSVVRADYHNFTTLSGLPTRVQNTKAATKEISVLVRDHTNDPLTHSLDGTPSILVVFTSDAQETNVPSINKHSILIPVVLSESRPVVLFDERDERMPDESSVDMDELIRQLSNLFTFERDSATSQTAVELESDKHLDSDVRTQDLDLDAQSLDAFESDKEDALNETLVPADEKPELVARKRQPLDRLVGSERADVFRKLHASMGPGLTAACALAVFLSLVLGTNHLIQPKASKPLIGIPPSRCTTMAANVPIVATSLPTVPPSSLAVKSPHTSLALMSTDTSLATKSPHTSLAAKSQHTSLSVRSSVTSLATKSQHTSLSVRGPVNESCSTIPISEATSTSLSTTLASTSLSTIAPSASATTEPKKRVLDEVVEELGNTIDRIERAMGLNLRRNTEAALKALESIHTEETIIEVGNRAKAVSDEAKEELHDRHQTARRTAQRQLANLKQGFESLVWGEEDVKGKGKEKDEAPEKTTKVKTRSKETPRPGRGKWRTSKDQLCQRGKDNLKSSKSTKDEPQSKKDGSQSKPKSKPKRKASFPTREEQEKAQTAGRAKRPTKSHPDEASMWVWDEYEYEYPFGYGPRAVMEEVREYFF